MPYSIYTKRDMYKYRSQHVKEYNAYQCIQSRKYREKQQYANYEKECQRFRKIYTNLFFI